VGAEAGGATPPQATTPSATTSATNSPRVSRANPSGHESAMAVGRGTALTPSWYHAGLQDAAFTPLRRWTSVGGRSLWLAVVVACAPPPPETPIGVSASVPDLEPAPASAASGQRRSAFAAALTWPEAAPPARSLVHRRDGSMLRVRIDPAIPQALAAYRALSAESALPEGTRIVAWHETPSGGLLGGYVLEKRAGAWSALEVDEHGAVIPGDRTACVRCHDMAPADHLFGAPTGPNASGSPTAESIAPASR